MVLASSMKRADYYWKTTGVIDKDFDTADVVLCNVHPSLSPHSYELDDHVTVEFLNSAVHNELWLIEMLLANEAIPLSQEM